MKKYFGLFQLNTTVRKVDTKKQDLNKHLQVTEGHKFIEPNLSNVISITEGSTSISWTLNLHWIQVAVCS